MRSSRLHEAAVPAASVSLSALVLPASQSSLSKEQNDRSADLQRRRAPAIRRRMAPGTVAGFISEPWPTSNRNPGRLHLGMPGRITSESARRCQTRAPSVRFCPLEGLRGEESLSELCRREGIAASIDVVARRILGSQRALPHWLQATRTEVGRAGSFMRLRALTAVLASVLRCGWPRDRSVSPVTRL